MKKLKQVMNMSGLVVVSIAFLIALPVQALTITPVPSVTVKVTEIPLATSSATKNPVTKEIEQLKDKLANKVSELQKKNTTAIAGTITTLNGTKGFNLKTNDNKIYKVMFDDVVTTAYDILGVAKKELKKTDLSTDDYVIVTGPVTDTEVTANLIYRDTHYYVGSGKITEVNKTDFTITVVTNEKETIVLDVEQKTKSTLLNINTLTAETIGFSKMKEGDTVHYVASKDPDEKTKNRYAALRIFIVPQEYFIK